MLKLEFRENIGPDYLHRWRAVPVIKWKDNVLYPPYNLYIHKILKSDKGRDLHDHPWPTMSIKLCGEMQEFYENDEGNVDVRRIPNWKPIFRSATFKHRLTKDNDGPPVWTLFFTGRYQRRWGFWPDGKFVPYTEYKNA